MILPRWLLIAILLLVVLGIVGFGLRVFGICHILNDIGNFALILTLAAVLAYVYYTYLLAKDASTPTASLNLRQRQEPGNIEDRFSIFCHIQSYSKQSLKCWCNINAKVYGQPVDMDGFYGAKSPWDLQPFGAGIGHFDIKKILEKVNKNIFCMKEEAPFQNSKEQLHFNVEFWYSPIQIKDNIIKNPPQSYYFDFVKELLILDV